MTRSVDDDFALLLRWRADDRQAGEQLCAKYFDEIYRFFEYKIAEKADDLVQQTFMACVRARDQFRNDASFRTYLFTIARNELYMELRKTRRDFVDLEVSSLNELVTSPSQLLGKHRELARLRAALREMPVEQQLLLEMHYWHDLPAADLATMFNTSPGSIRVRLLRARRALRDRLAGAPAAAGDKLWASLSEADLDRPEAAE